MDFAFLQSCFYQWVLHFHLLSNLSFSEREVKESQTEVVLYNVGISGRTIFFNHFVVDRDPSRKQKRRMYSKNFFFEWQAICCEWIVNIKERSGCVN